MLAVLSGHQEGALKSKNVSKLQNRIQRAGKFYFLTSCHIAITNVNNFIGILKGK